MSAQENNNKNENLLDPEKKIIYQSYYVYASLEEKMRFIFVFIIFLYIYFLSYLVFYL